MLEYDRVDLLERIDINKTNATAECNICHYWYFLDKNFKYQPYLCIGWYYQKLCSFHPFLYIVEKKCKLFFIITWVSKE